MQMEKIDKTILYNNLLRLYGKLLSSTQYEILTAYYNCDLSIGEIAIERGVSRAAIEDALQKGCSKLDEFENKLKLLKKEDYLLKILAKMKEKHLNDEDFQYIEQIERGLKHGI